MPALRMLQRRAGPDSEPRHLPLRLGQPRPDGRLLSVCWASCPPGSLCCGGHSFSRPALGRSRNAQVLGTHADGRSGGGERMARQALPGEEDLVPPAVKRAAAVTGAVPQPHPPAFKQTT